MQLKPTQDQLDQDGKPQNWQAYQPDNLRDLIPRCQPGQHEFIAREPFVRHSPLPNDPRLLAVLTERYYCQRCLTVVMVEVSRGYVDPNSPPLTKERGDVVQ